ncbi:MAG: cytidine deaminase [Prevotella sp.]
MNDINILTHIKAYTKDELDQLDRELVRHAIEATAHSYSPYSRFSVGACIRLADGSLMIGANQENAAYPSGLCAERTAIFSAQALHPDQHITAIAIAARDTSGHLTRKPISPCGACRQVMIEIEQRYKQRMRVILYGEDMVLCIDSASELLPLSFVGEDMNPQAGS